MGVRGIARDLAAAGLGVLRPLVVPTIAGEGAPATAIRTDDAEGCPAFYGRTIAGVVNGSAPEWMRRRLEAIGQRSIRSEEHTSELQSLMRISYAVFCLKKKKKREQHG